MFRIDGLLLSGAFVAVRVKFARAAVLSHECV
jgi:hypothetical protein